MCELFGLSSDRKIDVTAELREFFKHGEYNPHGWGMASWDDEGTVAIVKEPVKSTESAKINELLASGFSCRGMFAHIRKATIGHVEYYNTHPFSVVDANGRRWTLVHNGTIFEFGDIEPFHNFQQGTTDSESLLLYILSRNENVKTAQERFALLDSIVVDLSAHNKLNILLFDGEYLYVHKNEAKTMYRRILDGYTYFSTKPLDNEIWDEVPINRLLVYRDGRQVFEGTVHDHTYVHDEQQMNMLYMGYSAL